MTWPPDLRRLPPHPSRTRRKTPPLTWRPARRAPHRGKAAAASESSRRPPTLARAALALCYPSPTDARVREW